MRNSIPPVAIAATLLISPMPAVAQCSPDSFCGVGAFGTGGINSDGKAVGNLFRRPGSLEGFTLWHMGSDPAGRLVVYKDGELYGFFEGTIRDEFCAGMTEGLRWGDFTGRAPPCE